MSFLFIFIHLSEKCVGACIHRQLWRLVEDQDNGIVDLLLLCTRLASRLSYAFRCGIDIPQSILDIIFCLDPSPVLFLFCDSIGWDASEIFNFLVSKETSFLEMILKYVMRCHFFVRLLLVLADILFS